MSYKIPSILSDPLHITVIAVFFVLMLTHFPAAYESVRHRDKVAAMMAHANKAKVTVESNALKRLSFTQGWVNISSIDGVGIRVDSLTGVITITYPWDIDGGGKTLMLLPMYESESSSGRAYYPLYIKLNSGIPILPEKIRWVCTSKFVRAKNVFINDNLGTLHSKYAPTGCRYVIPPRSMSLTTFSAGAKKIV